MTSQQQVLVVEDEPKIAQILVDFLSLEGFLTHVVHDGDEAEAAIKQVNPDCVILDLMLPGKDGLSICKDVRKFSHVPIIMLTARVDEIDRLMGLGFGADDYVCKPFSPREVVARVQALLRRAALGAPTEKTAPNILTFKHIRIDTERFECTINGSIIELTPVEFRLLKTLLGKPGTVFSREILMQRCYEDARIVSNRTIDSHMKNLRNKISLVDDPQPILQSVYGVGYKLM
ncbi:MAG: two-component system response regulator BaeR [Alteromonadaceae bacterium]|uniref:response regulator n=1 Tax=Paraglaciecola chathamensis TaxID=368405 RepID=UPI000C3CF27A|nr:response regulator [Paraglaciecola agarilytica]MBN27359.1 two-component system response regulator BaeR [Alteromonadaceae bacterium]|tara:strand:+ start:55813 stop:56508 length:696 start_codon:yes stop_codon:yes gene_type:complete